jgi:hypothetical protein
VNLANVPEPGFQKEWRQKLPPKSECHAITNKYPEADSVVQQIRKLLSGIEILAKCRPARVGESSQWTTIMNSAEENRTKFRIFFRWEAAFQRLLWHVQGNIEKLKTILKGSKRVAKSGAVNKTSLKSTAQDDDFQEVKRRKRHISTDTSETNQSQYPQLPPKAVPSRNLFAPLRTNDMDTETTGAGCCLIRIQRDLK